MKKRKPVALSGRARTKFPSPSMWGFSLRRPFRAYLEESLYGHLVRKISKREALSTRFIILIIAVNVEDKQGEHQLTAHGLVKTEVLTASRIACSLHSLHVFELLRNQIVGAQSTDVYILSSASGSQISPEKLGGLHFRF